MIAAIIILSIVAGLAGGFLFVQQKRQEKKREKADKQLVMQKNQDREREEQRERYRLEDERKRILRANQDIIIQETSHEMYNVILVKGDGEKLFLHYNNNTEEPLRESLPMPKTIEKFIFMPHMCQRENNGYLCNFEKDQLVIVRQVIEHYLKHKTLDPVKTEVERFIVERLALPPEDAKTAYKSLGYKGETPSKDQLQTLIPQLIEAVDNDDVEGEIEILGKLEEVWFRGAK